MTLPKGNLIYRIDPASEIVTVRLDPQKRLGGRSELKQDVSSNRTTEVVILDPDYLFNRFSHDNDARTLYTKSLFGFEKIGELLKGTYFETRTPILHYRPFRKTTALEPVLFGFYEDPRVFVKSVESIRYSITGGLIRRHKNDTYQVTASIESPLNFLRIRDYEFSDDGILVPCRIPIILSGERNITKVFAGLSYEVMLHQLEPITSGRINERMRKLSMNSAEDLIKLIEVGLTEEEIVATGITKYCLGKIREQYGLDSNEVALFNPGSNHPDDVELSMLQVQREGIEGVVNFYRNHLWDIINYLNGLF